MAEGDRSSTSGGAEALSEEEHSPEALEDNITLSFLDKLKCMMYSKVERDAFLIEKLEKEEKKKGAAEKLELDRMEGKKKKKKKTLLGQLKSIFSSPEEQHEFLQKQINELEEQQSDKALPTTSDAPRVSGGPGQP